MPKRQRCTKELSVGEVSHDKEDSGWSGSADKPRMRVCVEMMDDAAAAAAAAVTGVALLDPFPQSFMDAASNHVADPACPNMECEALVWLRKMWNTIELKKGSKWKPTPIQLQTWPILLQNSTPTLNFIAIAPTGSGKTLAFGLSILCHCLESKKGVRAVCLLPTRELALQVTNELKGPARVIPAAKITCLFGGKGVDRDDQIQALHRAKCCPMIVVATPGRLLDLLTEEPSNVVRNLFSGIQCLVLDEADRLAGDSDMCLQINKIRAIFPNHGSFRTCLFSATKKRSVSEQWNAWAGKPRVVIQMDTRTFSQNRTQLASDASSSAAVGGTSQHSPVVTTGGRGSKRRNCSGGSVDVAQIPMHIAQTLQVIRQDEKPRELISTIQKIRHMQGSKRNKSLTVVFFARIKTLQTTLKLLLKEGIEGCAEYHGKLSQGQREGTLADFRSGKRTILLATELAARGIHVPNLEHVINYDFPESLEQYVHRCGRAGRTQKNGKPMNGSAVYSFFTTADNADTTMASDAVELLRATNSWLDPNLVALAEGK